LRLRRDSVSVSSVLLTFCLLSWAPPNLKTAATWRQRSIMVTERLWRYNSESLLAFASLALLIIGLIVIWTGYQRRMRSAWFVMLVFVLVYFLPVYVLNIFLIMRSVGWRWWPEVVRGAIDGSQDAQVALEVLIIFTTMLIALLLPVRAFFGKSQGDTPTTSRNSGRVAAP
jgi:hypothetical protein